MRNDKRAGSVARDVDHGAAHVEDAVNASNQGDAFDRQANRSKHHGEHNHASTRNARGANRGKRCGQNDGGHLAQRKVNAEARCNENRANALVNCGAVHVNGGAQRQNEGGHFVLCAHLLAAFHVDGQRAYARSAGEREDHSGHLALEELQGAHATHGAHGGGVHQEHMNQVAYVCAQKNHGKRAQNLGAVVGDNGNKQTEHANRRKLQNHVHALHGNDIHGFYQFTYGIGSFASKQNSEAEQQRQHDDLQHGALIHGCNDVGREDVHYGVHKGNGIFCVVGKVAGFQNGEKSLEQKAAQNANNNGASCGAQVVDDGFQANRANLADVAHGNNAADHREDDYGHNNELQQVQENGTEGLDVRIGESGILLQ